MRMNHIHDMNVGFQDKVSKKDSGQVDPEGILVSERIQEIMMMCDREQPIYEQITSFSIALYTLGYFDCEDLMSFQDVDESEAADILQEHFTRIRPKDILPDYNITTSREKYLLVIGDPLFPKHFAVLADSKSPKPFFSKLPFFGSGFDSLEELLDEFTGVDGVDRNDIHYFRKTFYGEIPPESIGKIYIIKDD